jgi:hypothetical protein
LLVDKDGHLITRQGFTHFRFYFIRVKKTTFIFP